MMFARKKAAAQRGGLFLFGSRICDQGLVNFTDSVGKICFP
jgi:hypothetical protein